MSQHETFTPGRRVRVADDYHWAQGATGVIQEPADELKIFAEGWSDGGRVVPGTAGPMTFVWVEFDEPQLDGDGDGPYHAAEIDVRVLTLL